MKIIITSKGNIEEFHGEGHTGPHVPLPRQHDAVLILDITVADGQPTVSVIKDQIKNWVDALVNDACAQVREQYEP